MCVHVFAYTCVHVCVCAYVCVRLHMCVCVRVCVCFSRLATVILSKIETLCEYCIGLSYHHLCHWYITDHLSSFGGHALMQYIYIYI